MSNSVDPDETAHYEPSHLDLCCLQKPNLSPVTAKELTITIVRTADHNKNLKDCLWKQRTHYSQKMDVSVLLRLSTSSNEVCNTAYVL